MDLAGTYVHRGEQIRSCVPNIVVSTLLGGSERDRQRGLGPVQRLDLRFLINAEHHRPTWRIQVEADDIGDLLREVGVFADLECSLPMRFQPALTPEPGHIGMRDSPTFRSGYVVV